MLKATGPQNYKALHADPTHTKHGYLIHRVEIKGSTGSFLGGMLWNIISCTPKSYYICTYINLNYKIVCHLNRYILVSLQYIYDLSYESPFIGDKQMVKCEDCPGNLPKIANDHQQDIHMANYTRKILQTWQLKIANNLWNSEGQNNMKITTTHPVFLQNKPLWQENEWAYSSSEILNNWNNIW